MKSFHQIKIYSFLGLFFVMAAGCTKKFQELNTSPSLLIESKVNAELLITGVEFNAFINANSPQGQNYDGEGGNAANYAGMTVNNANAPFVDDINEFIWDQTYTTLANNLAAIIRITADDADLVNKKAIARILKVWVFSRATDTYGDIPYSQANLAPEKAIPNPVYDTQESIYTDFFKELKEAAAELDPAKASYGSADLLYQGDVAKWKKFANSLRLRLGLRVFYVNPQMAHDNISDLTEADLITNRSDDAIVFTQNDVSDHRNLNFNALVQYGTAGFVKGTIGKTFLDVLVGSGDSHHPEDPRTKVIADTAIAKWPPTLTPPIPYFGYRGSPLLGNVPVEEKYPYGAGSVSLFTDLWYVPSIEVPVIRSSEVYQSLAEAALNGLVAGDPNDYFRKGIAAGIVQVQDFYNDTKDQLPDLEAILNPSMSSADISTYIAGKEIMPAEVTAFLAKPETTLSGDDDHKLEQIIDQKMIALYPNSLEGWTEWRRTGYPRVLVAADESSALKGVGRRREHYPAAESFINSAHLKDAVDRLGGVDGLLKKIWWDTNPDAPHAHAGTVESQPAAWQ